MNRKMRAAMLASVSICACALAMGATGAAAQAQGGQEQSTRKIQFEIPAQPLSTALISLARQSGETVLAQPQVTEGRRVGPVSGSYTMLEALDQLLGDSGLKYQYRDDQSYLVTASADTSTSDYGLTRRAAAGRAAVRVAQVANNSKRSAADASGRDGEGIGDASQEPDEFVITGTRIRGVNDQFSPVTRIGREEMDLAGYANLADVFDDLPQNFGGGVALDTGTGSSSSGVGSVGVNLRGLGNEATLVLLNGRRLAPGGGFGSFVDISSIPASAIDRIEVVTDGASAIYGSDAIAGVVNIILRDDFHGAESRLNLSTITDGGGNTLKAAQTVGFSGARAHGLVSYEYSTEDELDASDKDFAAGSPDPTFLLPFNQKHSAFASGGAALSDRVKISADGFYNDRKSKVTQTTIFAQSFQEVDVEQYGGAASVNIRLFDDWEGDIVGTYSKSNFLADTQSLHLGPNAGVLFESETEIISIDASVGGSLFNISTESVRAVLGVHHRMESAEIFRFIKQTDRVSADIKKDRDVFAVYGEIYAPLVSRESAIPGVERLAVTFAARYEDYSDVGSSFDPKVGAVWTPFAGLNVRGSYGTSFRAPRLDQAIDDLSAVILGVLVDPLSPTGESTAIQLTGTTSDLDPEDAQTWSIGFDYEPPRFESVQLRGTYFNIEYDGRIDSPTATFEFPSFRFASFGGVPIRDPSPETVQSLVDSAASFFDLSDIFPSLGDLDLADVSVLLDERPQNISISNVEGIDLSANYSLYSGIGEWVFSFNSTILTEFSQQFSVVSDTQDLLNTFDNPADLRLRGGVTWATQAMTSAFFVNHVGGYTDDEASSGPVTVDSWTTVDATVRFDMGDLFNGHGPQDMSLSFSVLNMFNEDPPTIGVRATGIPIYDAANADPAGRRFGVLLTKRW